MHLDLSQLKIPDVSVVPEPTAEQIKSFRQWLSCERTEPIANEDPTSGSYFWCLVSVSLARRCRKLEAEVAGDYQVDLACVTKPLNSRIADLEAEIERLKSKKCVHDLAREFSKETTSGY